MSRKSLTKQDHLFHILLLAGFLVSLALINFSSLSENPALVVSVAVAYIVLNTAVDINARKFHIDQLLEYSTVGLLATVVILSF